MTVFADDALIYVEHFLLDLSFENEFNKSPIKQKQTLESRKIETNYILGCLEKDLRQVKGHCHQRSHTNTFILRVFFSLFAFHSCHINILHGCSSFYSCAVL